MVHGHLDKYYRDSGTRDTVEASKGGVGMGSHPGTERPVQPPADSDSVHLATQEPGKDRIYGAKPDQRCGKQAGKHLGGIQLEPCPIGACYLITWRLEPRWMRQGQAGT